MNTETTSTASTCSPEVANPELALGADDAPAASTCSPDDESEDIEIKRPDSCTREDIPAEFIASLIDEMLSRPREKEETTAELLATVLCERFDFSYKQGPVTFTEEEGAWVCFDVEAKIDLKNGMGPLLVAQDDYVREVGWIESGSIKGLDGFPLGPNETPSPTGWIAQDPNDDFAERGLSFNDYVLDPILTAIIKHSGHRFVDEFRDDDDMYDEVKYYLEEVFSSRVGRDAPRVEEPSVEKLWDMLGAVDDPTYLVYSLTTFVSGDHLRVGMIGRFPIAVWIEPDRTRPDAGISDPRIWQWRYQPWPAPVHLDHVVRRAAAFFLAKARGEDGTF